MSDKDAALEAINQVLDQVGVIAVTIYGLIVIEEAIRELPDDYIRPLARKKEAQNERY